MSRWKAFAIHLLISMAVLLLVLMVIVNVWYPGILFSIDGGWNGLKIVIGVDVVLGPLLTLLIYRAGKPGLKFDLACIGTLQLACLLGGLLIVYQERPIALVMAYDTFFSLARKEFEDYGKDPALLEAFPGSYPKLLYTDLPENDVSADIVGLRSQFIGDPLFIQTERYQTIPRNAADIFRRVDGVRSELGQLVTLDPQARECLLARFVSAHINGFVCFDPEKRQLSRFFNNSTRSQAGDR